MLIHLDATGAALHGAGIVTYTTGLLRGWRDAGFDDRFVVEGTHDLDPGIVRALGDQGTVHRSGSGSAWSRIAVQQLGIPRRIRRIRPDVLLCTTPVVPARTFGVPVVATVHDLRHLSRPDDFGNFQNRYRRRVWPSGIHRADRVIAVSDRTRRDLEQAYPAARSKVDVVHNGADHVDPRRRDGAGHGIAFARWANKRPRLAVETWAELNNLDPGMDRILHITGAPEGVRAELEALARRLGVGDLVTTHPFLPDEQFWDLFASAGVVLFTSGFEGFGLPVLEAMRLKVPVVTWRDPAIVEVAGECVVYAEPTPQDFARGVYSVLRPEHSGTCLIDPAFRRTEDWTWKVSAEKTREVLKKAVDRSSGV